MLSPRTRPSVGIVTLLLAVGCTAPQSGVARIAERTPLSLSWTWDASDNERTLVDSLVQKSAAIEFPGLSVIDGMMFQLPTDSDPFRLLLAIMHPTRGVLLFAIGDSVDKPFSPPFVTGIPDERDRFRDGDIRDFDGDGRADFQYCWWPADSGAEQMRIVGYQDSVWYEIQTPKFQPLPCSAGRN